MSKPKGFAARVNNDHLEKLEKQVTNFKSEIKLIKKEKNELFES